MAAYVELYMDQGTTFRNIINITDDLTNGNVSLLDYNVKSQMRRSFYSQNVTANLVCQITDAVAGEITISLAAANTANIKAGRYLFDLQTIDPQNTVVRVLEGMITVTPRVTT